MEEYEAIIQARHELLAQTAAKRTPPAEASRDCEGGCGVIGIIGTEALSGKLIIRPCAQMRNRGNGKGGGVAAVGLFPDFAEHYAIHIAYLDESVRAQLEIKYIYSQFDVAHAEAQPSVADHRSVGLEIKPPLVWRYFCRVKKEQLRAFAVEHGLQNYEVAEDEFVYQNSFYLNCEHYVQPTQPQAFVLSHGRNLMILKAVGYAEEIASYYCLEDVKAQVWIGHQRFPTRGRVWHPGGAHPFAGLHEALVHNGDFANYHAVTEYLRQRGIVPLFTTDTEVSVLLFDLYSRVLGYPLEYVIEALGPTPRGDFERLSKRRQRIYRALQTAHLHGSPDGPWFFIIARAEPSSGQPQLIGITDVSMLRPQVFSLQVGKESYAAIASEKQAIDAFFQELAALDPKVPPAADYYWNARGGSCTDGGAFVFTAREANGQRYLEVQDKFGNQPFQKRVAESTSRVLGASQGRYKTLDSGRIDGIGEAKLRSTLAIEKDAALSLLENTLHEELKSLLRQGKKEEFLQTLRQIEVKDAEEPWLRLLAQLSYLHDRKWDYEGERPASVISTIEQGINETLCRLSQCKGKAAEKVVWLDYSLARNDRLLSPTVTGASLVIDAQGFSPEGEHSLARLVVAAYKKGWKNFVLYRLHGDRFVGCGLGPDSAEVRIDVYGASGDYLGSGLDGASIYVHGNAQDQVGQILKSGRLVIFGDVGQTFLYGAKGGEAYVMGSAAGRPLINAVGKIRAIINGSCLDYCAESFMAGEQLGGGFVIINGLAFDRRGVVIGLELKYPGNNLFSLASGGACYLNDPYQTVSEQQLNSASFVPFSHGDWNVILPYLQANEELFGIEVREDLLVVDGVLKWPKEVFRKVVASSDTQRLDWSSLPA